MMEVMCLFFYSNF